jgi:hypothetical protein
VALARAELEAELSESLVGIARTGKNGDGVRMKALVTVLERRYPEHWAQQQQITGTVRHQVLIAQLPTLPTDNAFDIGTAALAELEAGGDGNVGPPP